MRLKIVVMLALAILIPTALLAYFGLHAVRSEKEIVEASMRERHEFMAEVVLGGINTKVSGMSKELLKNRAYLESVLIGEASIFKGQTEILDKDGRPLGRSSRSFARKEKRSQQPVISRPILDLPYTLAIYERYPPPFMAKLEERKKGFYFYIFLIGLSTVLILSGTGFALWRLSREWRSAELKSEFVSILSHDLRRPLTSIKMFAEMLRDGRITDEKKKEEYYDIMHSESERLTLLANNILDFSRIERGRNRYNFKYEDISAIVRDTIDHFNVFMGDENRKVAFSVEDELPQAKIDVNAISQATMNLLTNAAKFSPADKEIKIRLRRDKKSVIMEVADEGIGISKEEQKKIFRKFYRILRSKGHDEEGSGLGLTLVKYIAEAHKGRVEVESEVGKGSKFSLVLPI